MKYRDQTQMQIVEFVDLLDKTRSSDIKEGLENIN
jgi:hypothetical protein